MFNLNAVNGAATVAEYQALMAEAADKMENVRDLAKKLAELRGEGEGADGLIQVQVLPSGAFDSLGINPRAMKLASTELAEAITEAAQAAFNDVSSKMAEMLEGALPGTGADLAAMTDPAELAKGRFGAMEQIDSIVDSMRGRV